MEISIPNIGFYLKLFKSMVVHKMVLRVQADSTDKLGHAESQTTDLISLHFFLQLLSNELLRVCGDLIHLVAEDEKRNLFLHNTCTSKNFIEVPGYKK